MDKKKFVILVALAVSMPLFTGCVEKFEEVSGFSMETIDKIDSEREQSAIPVVVSEDNPFYALIATPVALYYDEDGEHVNALLVENFKNPSKAIKRFKGFYSASYKEIRGGAPENVSIELSKIWKRSDAVLLIEDSQHGYELGITATPIASYLNIPVFVTNDTNNIRGILKKLGVKYTFICGNLEGHAMTWRFENEEEINNFIIDLLKNKFGDIDYVTITNPLDVTNVNVLNETYYEFQNVTASADILPAQLLNIIFGGIAGLNDGLFGINKFVIPEDYKYARLSIDLINDNSEYVSELGDDLIMLIYSPDDEAYVYTSTSAGIPEVENGDIVVDKIHYETIIYNKPGTYTAQVLARRVGTPNGQYTLKIRVQKVDSPLQPLMNNLSSMAPYLTAYHRGIILSDTDFAFAGNESIGVEGVVYASTNEGLVEPCNQHVMKIHEKLNSLLAKIANISADDTEALWRNYRDNPINIAIMADPTMVPMYYYYNPDSDFIGGIQLPSDFIYGDIDPKPDDVENNTYTYYPFQENAVGRITGYDAEDCSALIARTVFYNEIIQQLGKWKENATVQTGAGLEFQWIPLITPLTNMLTGGHEPTKWPTGESFFINLRLADDMERGGYNVRRTHLLPSQREGFEDLAKYTSRLNIPFPNLIEFISGERNVKGGEYQRNSNLIFVFNHGIYFLYESGDVLLDSRGFPPITWLSRFLGPLGIASGLSSKGAYSVRYVVNDDYGPSVIFVESCITARTDGLLPENCLSQAYLHAGVNAYIGATRVTADPGYLEPGLIFKGFGAKGFVKASLNLLLRNEYPEPHFGAVVAEDFILDLVKNDSTVGMALRNAKNAYLPKDVNSTFLWTPPLEEGKTNARFEHGKYLDKKYVCLHEFTLYGDPAFNPYQPSNNG
ncbi:MAG TPA: hypothetical protein ENI33_03440 [Thermoplasmatales archaeon]|nr:hypothetical protein [Thermoplasmatales archaeon]